MVAQEPTTPADSPWPDASYAWFVVVILALANAVSFVDRLILSLLVPEIKADLGLSDTEISLLQGFAFALFYAFMGLPIARLADSKNRKYIIVIGVTLWSLMTAVCGLARNFAQIFMARVGVGVGEASLSPSAYSILADYFPPNKLALPIGAFSAGVSGGMGLSFIAGAAAIQAVAAIGVVYIPFIGPLANWRLVFVMVGALGIFIVVLMTFVREPVRRGAPADNANDTKSATSIPIREVWAYLKGNWKLYLFVMGGYGFTSISIYGVLSWTPAFYMRSFGVTAPEAGFILGTFALLGGVSGALVGGAVADWLERRGDENAKLRVLFVCCLVLIFPGIIAPLMPNIWMAAGVLFFSFFFGTMPAGPTGAFVQIITPNRMRAQFGAIYQLALNLLGLGIGPTAVALITDFVFMDEMMVRYSIAISVAIFNPLAALFVWLGYRHYPKVRESLVIAKA
jgi:MFS family permease